MNITQTLAQELAASAAQITAAIELLDNGATVPFIARYRKEATGGLDDTQLRTLAERLQYLRELEARKETVLNSIAEQGKLTDELRAAIDAADNKTALEDLYLPYKPKRRTKAQIAREHGLQPLADTLLADQPQDIETLAAAYTNENIPDAKAALDGARAILMEQFAENAELIGALREKLWAEGELHAQVIEGKEGEGEKYKDYFDHREAIRSMPSHRALAVLRGRNEGVLQLALKYQPDETPATEASAYEQTIAAHYRIGEHKWLRDSVRLAWRAKIYLSLELDALNRLKEAADNDAITVFARNLKDLLLAAPAGRLTTLGLDPGYRNGVKSAVVDDTGKLLDTAIVYLHQENNALSTLARLIKTHGVKLIAIGNGTASRETDKLAGELIKALPDMELHKIVVSEAGASIYSASELAAKEFPELDVSLRGAVSIARRLQDPLAELVKIDPKSIGVGQYQHDVNQSLLKEELDATVIRSVNKVGVNLNTASKSLLTYVSGIGEKMAENIVTYRAENGAFTKREDLKKVPRLGEKAYQQAVAFLRVHNDKNPLDNSAVHPEAYPIIKKMAKDLDINEKELIGNKKAIDAIKIENYITENTGILYLKDMLKELEKPGLDPRKAAKVFEFDPNVKTFDDVKTGMILNGIVNNITAFGCFVDIGIKESGLVHISQLKEGYVSDVNEVVKLHQQVQAKVLEVDENRKRISLSLII